MHEVRVSLQSDELSLPVALQEVQMVLIKRDVFSVQYMQHYTNLLQLVG